MPVVCNIHCGILQIMRKLQKVASIPILAALLIAQGVSIPIPETQQESAEQILHILMDGVDIDDTAADA